MWIVISYKHIPYNYLFGGLLLHFSSCFFGQGMTGAPWKLGGVKFQVQLMLIDALGDVRAVRNSQSTHEVMNRNVNNSFSPINFWGSCLAHSFLSHWTNYIWWVQAVLEGFVTVTARLFYAHVCRSLLWEGVGWISSKLNLIDLKDPTCNYPTLKFLLISCGLESKFLSSRRPTSSPGFVLNLLGMCHDMPRYCSVLKHPKASLHFCLEWRWYIWHWTVALKLPCMHFFCIYTCMYEGCSNLNSFTWKQTSLPKKNIRQTLANPMFIIRVAQHW